MPATLIQAHLDAFSQQRRIRAGSLIISAFGDAIYPRGGRIWLGSLIRLLKPLGIAVPVSPLKGYSLTLPIEQAAGAPMVSITDYERKVVYARLGERLRIAAKLLLEGEYTVSEISEKVGFSDSTYFYKCFKNKFGIAPSKYGK